MYNPEFLTKDEIKVRYDSRLSYRAKEAIAMMDDTPTKGSGLGDVGRLMQIQGFIASHLTAKRKESRRLQTWRQHYKDRGVPFLVVRGPCNRIYIYKYRVIEDGKDD